MRQIIMDIINNSLRTGDKPEVIYSLLDSLPIGVVMIQEHSFGANKQFYNLIETADTFQTTEEYLSACKTDYLLYREFPKLLADTDSFTRLYSIQTFDRQEYYIENSTFILRDEQNRIYYVSTLLNQTAMNDLSIQFDAFNTRYQILEELSADYTFEYDLDADILHFPERWKPDGINTDYPHARKWLELHEIIHPEEMMPVIDAMTSSRAFKEPRTLEFRAHFLKDEYTWFRVMYKLVRSRHTGTLRAIGKIRNIDKEHKPTAGEDQAGIDSLTGLFIPSFMQNCVDQILAEELPDNLCALMLLQLDDFAKIKKKTGDLYSNKIEHDVANKLKHSFRNTDVLGYSQDGCYMVFMNKIPEHIITLRAKHVLEAVREINDSLSEHINLTCSIGISLAPLDASKYMELFLKADSAMYLSKARGGNTFSFFNIKVDARQHAEQP